MTPSSGDSREGTSAQERAAQGAASGASVQGLSTEEKRMLLRSLLRSKADPTAEPFPLSLGQRALWFLQRLVPESNAYNIPVAVRCTPPLDLTHLRSALEAVVARHPALRMRFDDEGGTPRQRSIPPGSVTLDVHEAPDSEFALQEAALAEVRRPFDLTGPLMRAAIWRAPASDLLVITIHHLVFDGRSGAVLLHDLGALYRAASTNAPHGLASLSATHRDFVVAEQQLLGTNAPEATRLWNYWERQLDGPWEDLTLPSLRPRPPRMSLRGDSIPLDLTFEQADRIKAIAQSQRATFYPAIYTLVQTLLYQFTGQADLVIGTPTSARSHAAWNDVIGYFVNTLPIRAPLAKERSFASQIRFVHEQVLGALAHQQFPFAAMVERLRVTRDPARTPIFQTLVNVMSANQRATPDGQVEAPKLFGHAQAEPYVMPNLEGQFDLAVEMSETSVGWTGFLKYSLDALDSDTAGRMRQAFYTMLDLVIEHPDWTIQQLVAEAAQRNTSAPSLSANDDESREDLSF